MRSQRHPSSDLRLHVRGLVIDDALAQGVARDDLSQSVQAELARMSSSAPDPNSGRASANSLAAMIAEGISARLSADLSASRRDQAGRVDARSGAATADGID